MIACTMAAGFAMGLPFTRQVDAAPTAPTHAAVYDSIAARVADDLAPAGMIPPGRPLDLQIPLPGDTLSILEQRLLQQLKIRGVTVRLLGSRAPARIDTITGARVAESNAFDQGGTPLRMEARIESRSVTYLRRIGRFPFGTKGFERLVTLQAQSRLVDGASGEVLWARTGSARSLDLVPSGDVDAVASSGLGMFRPGVPPRRGLRFLEPTIVAGVIVGLVVLFYSNRT
jgi:hypothetical protein